MVIYIRLIESVGPFICPEGYVVVDKPDVTAAEWAALLDAPLHRTIWTFPCRIP